MPLWPLAGHKYYMSYVNRAFPACTTSRPVRSGNRFVTTPRIDRKPRRFQAVGCGVLINPVAGDRRPSQACDVSARAQHLDVWPHCPVLSGVTLPSLSPSLGRSLITLSTKPKAF